jgi:glycyl-tRNA synthetase beta chain
MMLDTFADLLVEIGTEELPPKALQTLSKAFADGFEQQLRAHGISYSEIERFAAPRRLALLTKQVSRQQPDQESLRRGPAVQAAFDAKGAPTPAAVGFARSCGVAIDELEREQTEKGQWLVFRSRVKGRTTAELAPALAEAALGALPIPKRMRWGTHEVEFIRPVHWICLMQGDDAIAGQVLGVAACTRTYGHRFHHPAAIALSSAGEYGEALRTTGFVEASFERRRELIRKQVTELADSHGLRARLDSSLLDEVTALVEWPQAILCRFDGDFLDIPPEVLIETMQSNQKYFPLENGDGVLQASFIAIANLISRDPAQVRAGNERVIRPRFSDAAFFWSQDNRQPLESFRKRLETVVFQDKLGTVAAKSCRVAKLGCSLANTFDTDPTLIDRAANLAKCDLVTSMVYEFPGLQGIMGRYYAERSGEHPDVCRAMEEQYLPRFAGDMLPTGACGRALALSERLDTLVGIFGIGLRPSGTKDPYGLRRASIAVLRILVETPLDLDLRDLLIRAIDGYQTAVVSADTLDATLGYMLDRLRSYYADRGVAMDSVEAVLGSGATNPWDIDRRVAAVTAFRSLPEAEALAAANKRIRNILTKAGVDVAAETPVDESLLTEPTERTLFVRIREFSDRIKPLADQRKYQDLLIALAGLRTDVDAFFDEVMVMAEDDAVRLNRIRLLQRLFALFLRVADLSRLQSQ